MDSPENAAPEGHEPVTESHDPPVPEAYSAFMRTGWGERHARIREEGLWRRAGRVPVLSPRG